ncbi:Transposase [Phytophthora palmivora]|uniref:Transposase n=1 Tax=Phytophthora palmivora TaxID=4796 RepID=A0A2P4YGD3_9STRA|nr:Transposase [Phytophthora palmivora]
MQGVDRLDQTRGRFSLSDGHSFKKWYKKLGFALIDVARANAYFTRKLALNSDDERDSHKTFVAQLSSELISGKYATEVTDFCVLHGVCLCQHVSVTTKPFTCVNPTWTCWEKYHRFYLPRKLFSAKGKVRTSCEPYKMNY